MLTEFNIPTKTGFEVVFDKLNNLKLNFMKNKFYSKAATDALVIICYVFAGLWSTNVNAQAISTYTWAQSTDTVTDISTTGTALATGCCHDDMNYSPVTIPFAFTYHGAAFTTVGITDDCFMVLGGIAFINYVPLGGLPNCISMMGADMYGNQSSTSLRYQTTGSAPNRVFRVQWSNWGKYSTGLNEFTAQIQLFETTNKVAITYMAAPGATTFTCQVGLTGATVSDFNIRATTTDWSATTAGGSNTATMKFSSTVKPSSNLTYTWSPPVNFVQELISDSRISIFPNPSDGLINIGLDKEISEGLMMIYNVMGKKIYSDGFNGRQKTVTCILSPGVYFLQVMNSERQYIRKIVVQ